jgi:3-oxoacyl-[acyl-carrier protein] reductase
MAQEGLAELAGMTAVITGSSSGIGRAIALQLAAAGASCLVHARANEVGVRRIAEEVGAGGVEARGVLYDLADETTHDTLVDEAWRWRGAIDIWVNNAGADVLTGEAARWSFQKKLAHLWQVDVLATISLARAVGARMKARGSGTIINMGWDRAEQGMAGDSGELFAATKGAVMAFTKSLACSLAPEVRVNCVAPGWIKTKWGGSASDVWQRRAPAGSLANRWGTPEDVASVVRFLASPSSSFVNSQIIATGGGITQP